MPRQEFFHFRRIEVQAVYHVPEIGFIVAIAALRFKPVGVDAVVVGKHLDTDRYIIGVSYQFFQHTGIVTAVNFIAYFILMLIEKSINDVFIESVLLYTFFFQFAYGFTYRSPFRFAVPVIYLFL